MIVDLQLEDHFEEVLEEIEDRNPGPWPRNFGQHQKLVEHISEDD